MWCHLSMDARCFITLVGFMCICICLFSFPLIKFPPSTSPNQTAMTMDESVVDSLITAGARMTGITHVKRQNGRSFGFFTYKTLFRLMCSWECSPLFSAASEGNVGLLQKLVAVGANVNVHDSDGIRPIVGAVSFIATSSSLFHMFLLLDTL